MCDSKELIVGFLYDELTTAERKEMAAHLAACGECRLELEGLRSTRGHLAAWSPPQPDLGFRMISGGSSPAPALPRRNRLAPAFGFAAAAVLVLAAAAGIANIEVRYGGDGVVVRTGWAGNAQAGLVQTQPTVARESGRTNSSDSIDSGSGLAFAELDRRLRSIETAIAQESSSGMQLASSPTRSSDAELLRQMRQMVNDAQAQQRTAFQHQMLQVVRDVQRQHMADIAKVQQGLEQYQGLTNAEIATSRDMFNQWIRASARQEK